MSMSALVRVLGAAAGGASRGMREAEEEARRKKKDAQEEEDRAFAIAERNRATKMRDDMAAAAAPVEVQQVEQAGPVLPGAEGAAGKPLAPVSRVQGIGYDTPELAAQAAQAANVPMAVAGRMADAAARGGDPVKAQQLRIGAMQEQASKYQLNAAERADLDARFNDQVDSQVNDFDSLGRFLSDSAADGAGGKVKMQMLPSADGKSIVAHVVMPDGSLKPTEKQWPNTPAGFLEAKELLKKTPPERKLAHLHSQAQLAQQAARDKASAEHQTAVLAETGRHNKATEGIAADKTAAQIEMAGMRAALSRGGGGGGGGGGGQAQPSGIDMAAADKFIDVLFTGKDELTGKTTYDPRGPQLVRGLMLRMPAAQVGDTKGAVNQALIAYDRALKNAGGDHDKAVQMLQAALNPAAPAPSPAQPAPQKVVPAPAPAPASAPARAPAAPQPGAGNPYFDTKGNRIAGAAPQGEPSLMTRAVIPAAKQAAADADKALADGYVNFLKAKIQRKETLTPAEEVRAKQFGLK